MPWSHQFPSAHFGCSTSPSGASRIAGGPCWWRRGSTSPAATTRRRPCNNGRECCRARWAMRSGLLVMFEVLTLTLGMTQAVPAMEQRRSDLDASRKTLRLANESVEQEPQRGLLTTIGTWGTSATGACACYHQKDSAPNGHSRDVFTPTRLWRTRRLRLRRHRRPHRQRQRGRGTRGLHHRRSGRQRVDWARCRKPRIPPAAR